MELIRHKPRFSRRRAITSFCIYEVKKNIRRKLVFTLIILGFIAIFASSLFIQFIKANPNIPGFVRASFEKYEWIQILSFPQFFISLIAIAIGGGLFSSEYEDGSSFTLYTMPLSRVDIYISKVLGGFILIIILIIIYVMMDVIISTLIFRRLESAYIIPILILAMIYSQLLPYSLAYMFSQLLKKTYMSIIVCIAIIFIFPAIQNLLLTYMTLFNIEYIKYFIYLFPTWASDIPIYIAKDLLPDLPLIGILLADAKMAAATVFGYFTICNILTFRGVINSDLVI